MDLVDEPYKQYEIREGIVFLIELSEAIYTPIRQLDDECQVVEILGCINDLLSEMIVTFPYNGVGIYFYNCSITGSKFAKNSGINKIFSLNDLNSSNMKSLIRTLQEEHEGTRSLKSKFTPTTEPSDNLHTVLKTVLREFQRKPQYNQKKLFWFTNNDKPYINEKLKDSLRTMMSDFEDNFIHVSPLFLDTFLDEEQHKTKHFDASLYKNIFLNTNYLRPALSDSRGKDFEEYNEDSLWSKTTVSSQIRDSIFRLKEVKRVQFSCDLVLSDGPGIGGQLGCSVKGYTLYNHERVRQFKKVSTESGEIRIVHTDTKRIKHDSGEEINVEHDKGGQALYKGISVKYANDSEREDGDPKEKIILLKPEILEFMKTYSFDHNPKSCEISQETNKIENIIGPEPDDLENSSVEKEVDFSNAPYLKLLCFRKVQNFQPYFNMKPPLFVAADLKDGMTGSSTQGGYKNSFETFRHLYQSCVRLRRYAILFGCTKKNSTPDLYALYPTNLKVFPGSKTPDGFLLINLPWLSEVRSLPDHMLTQSGGKFIPGNEEIKPSELVTLYEKILDHLTPWTSYEPSAHNNPSLQYFYKTIKQEALQLDVKDEDRSLEANDWTARELIKVRNKIDTDSDLQNTIQFLKKVLLEIEGEGAFKRPAEDEDTTSKKRKLETLSEAAVITMWKNDTWENVRVDQLREFMSRYDKIKRATRKADMISNIASYLESRRK